MNVIAVTQRALSLLSVNDFARFAELWAEDGVIEFPFAPPGYPQQVRGRAAIHEYLKDYPNTLHIDWIVDPHIHATDAPDVAVVEFAAAGTVVASGKPYEMRYISVVTVRDGTITRYRDYWSPAAAADIMGGLPEFVAAFGGTDAR